MVNRWVFASYSYGHLLVTVELVNRIISMGLYNIIHSINGVTC